MAGASNCRLPPIKRWADGRKGRKTPIEHTFIVERVIGEGISRRGDPFVEAKTRLGIVAFWGSGRNCANLRTIQSATPRFTVTCGCIQPAAGYAKRHALWVPETPMISEPVPGAGAEVGRLSNEARPT